MNITKTRCNMTAVVSPDNFAEFERARQARVQTAGLAAAFAQLRGILEEEGVQIDFAERREDELPARHQHHQ